MKGRFCVFILFIAVFGLSSIVLPTKGSFAADPVKIEVYDPTGAIEVTQLFAPRLSDLHGKTICELSNDTWEATRSLAAIRELLESFFDGSQEELIGFLHRSEPRAAAAAANMSGGDAIETVLL